jgi:hypothetical protein
MLSLAKATLLCIICLAPLSLRSEARDPARNGGSTAADTKTHNLQVALALKWNHGNIYDAKVSVTITDTCYHEGKLRLGLPHGKVGLPEVQYLTFPFTRDEGHVCGDVTRTVDQTIPVPFSPAKPKATAYAVVNGKVAGSDTQSFPRK